MILNILITWFRFIKVFLTAVTNLNTFKRKLLKPLARVSKLAEGENKADAFFLIRNKFFRI